MSKLILASGSPQRRKLLKNLGIKFDVRVSHAPEQMKVRTTCAALVKDNALIKARSVAEEIKRQKKHAVVIGADTVVYAGHNKIIGKPKSLNEAKKILKILFTQPQWVYTGVAVIDTLNNKEIVDYEKSQVFMVHLTDEEIDRYHKKVSPFDKAGGFDIEGWGSIFIHRIEGCYSNVIGLPMAKTAAMLKKVGISVLSLVCMVSLWGCTSEYNLATRQEEALIYGTDKEVKIGEAVAAKIDQKEKIVTDVDVNERVEKILDKIVEVCDRKDVVYFIKVIDEDLVNAVSLPGGYIYIFQGLIDKVKSDDELAGVIAHEVAHITARHGVKRIQGAYGALALQAAATQTNAEVAQGVGIALSSLFMEYSQQDEFQADSLAVKYLKKAGYDPNAMAGFLQKLRDEQNKAPAKQHTYWRTHPNLSKRIATVNHEVAGELEFRDYLNLMDEKTF
jgi:septum formation protein